MANPFSKMPTWGKFAVVGGGGAIIVFVWYQHKQNSAASTTSTSADSIDPATGLPYSEDNETDPQTGMTYAAEAEQYGSVSAAEAALGESADYGYATGDSAGIIGDYGDYYPSTDTTSDYTYSSNAEWAQAVESGLVDIGYTSTDVASAVGRYLGSLSLTSDQANIIQVAIAEYGNPPVGTFQIIQQSSTTPASTGTVAVPNVIGEEAVNAQPVFTTAGLTSTLSGPAFTSGTSAYRVITAESPSAGTQVAPGTNVTLTYEIKGQPAATPTVTVPNEVGQWADVAQPRLAAAGLKSTLSGPAFTANTGAVRVITAMSPAPGSKVAQGTSVKLTYKIEK